MEEDNNKIIVENFSTPLLSVDKPSRQKTKQET